MKWRIKKKKGLIETETDRKIKELICKGMKAEAEKLERRADGAVLPKEM